MTKLERIEELKRQLNELEAEVKAEREGKWKMKPAEWVIDVCGYIDKYPHQVTCSQKFGMKRHSKELAEISAKRMKQSNLLEYWAQVIDPDWMDEGIGKSAYYIYKETRAYNIESEKWVRDLGKVYMSEKAAKEICAALNSGELVL